MAMGKAFRIYEKSRPPNPHSLILEHRNQSQTLLFESQIVAVLTTYETNSLKLQYTKLLEAYGCLGVLPISSGENTFFYLVMITGCFSVGKIYDSEIFRITQTNFIPLHYTQTNNEDRIAEVRKVLNSGTFYFAWSAGSHVLDITLNAQKRYETYNTDKQFFWNRVLHVHLLKFGVSTDHWLLKVMCGSIEMRTVYGGHKQARAVLISRLSCERAGTRFNVRGTNDDGHVANFVETEQIIYIDNEVSSYVQIRGSVPLFWEQPGIQVGSHKIKISRGFEVSAPAFDKHFVLLKKRYGQQLILNLLSSSLTGNKEGETMLSELFQCHQNNSQHSDIPHIAFDYHQECRNGNLKNISKLKDKILVFLEKFNLFYSEGEKIIHTQQGIIRSNCLDCLDRTNCVQTFIALEILKKQLFLLKLSNKQQILSRFNEVFRQMWINNGNEISKIYAGTGAIQGNSKLIDGARSAARTIQNNLLDSNKQEAIDILLGSPLNLDLSDRARILLSTNMLLAHSKLLHEMCKRYKEYIEIKKLRVSIATYNVNGGKHFRSVAYKDIALSDWLLDASQKSMKKSEEYPIDLFVIGFEEIVDLNATNIMAASNENARAWADELQKVLSRDHKYVLVTYQQLVGVCLYIFIRPTYTNFLRDVAVDYVKTGLGGTTGNKGAVAIRFVLFSTSFCCICAHFTAGQSQVNERNADYAEITRKIVFPQGQTLNAHDYIFWCGDFNYRIDMDKEEMKELIKHNQIPKLLICDQLKNQQQLGNVFQNFLEGSINFLPTYKYDLFSDDYDTSEKCRQPAWTDRVLWKRQKFVYDKDFNEDWNSGKLLYYCRSELKQSDHRPVIATIDIDVHCVDTIKRDIIFEDVNRQLGPPDGTIILRVDEDCIDLESIFEDNFMNLLVQEFSELGEIILVRLVGNTIWITFRNSESALAAAKKKIVNVCDQKLEIILKSPNWISNVQKELDILENIDNTENLAILSTIPRKFKLCHSATSTSPKSIPPARPPQPVISKKQNIFRPTLLQTKQLNKQPIEIKNEEIPEIVAITSVDNSINNPESISIYTHSKLSNQVVTDPPPLPLRDQTSTPSIALSVPPISLPPPIPVRSSGKPPIPVRNNDYNKSCI
ncbi:PREDICTED: synaptojanin-1 isoform X1 [Ceratosolen solmsi marchali]|uniref:phosphoinositide 5-phosphatase n=2 Tax=Ceratosolen solmsi marchali TaxID=326594 RepID=A0AAJ6YTC6_9HYME|nr:PREDICTED: synaptojanin-1 isoform X1 [Ceratosolen solmsi marchali]